MWPFRKKVTEPEFELKLYPDEWAHYWYDRGVCVSDIAARLAVHGLWVLELVAPGVRSGSGIKSKSLKSSTLTTPEKIGAGSVGV